MIDEDDLPSLQTSAHPILIDDDTLSSAESNPTAIEQALAADASDCPQLNGIDWSSLDILTVEKHLAAALSVWHKRHPWPDSQKQKAQNQPQTFEEVYNKCRKEVPDPASMGQLLKNKIIAVVGSFGPDRSQEKIKGWIKTNGGTPQSGVTPATTHLVCDQKAFDSKDANGKISFQALEQNLSSLVMEAWKKAKDNKLVHPVNYDWLEDTLMQKKRRPEKPYLLQRQEVVKKERREKKKAVSTYMCHGTFSSCSVPYRFQCSEHV